jgi:hypothetical protein
MRKRVVGQASNQTEAESTQRWVDLQEIASVEVTSEDPRFPIESVFSSTGGPGWRAQDKGPQQIRIIFDRPMPVKRIHLKFIETEVERTQEFALRWSAGNGAAPKEVVRQQWNFSPSGSTFEVEDYDVLLDGASTLELVIRPDLTHGDAVATLAEWRIA